MAETLRTTICRKTGKILKQYTFEDPNVQPVDMKAVIEIMGNSILNKIKRRGDMMDSNKMLTQIICDLWQGLNRDKLVAYLMDRGLTGEEIGEYVDSIELIVLQNKD